MKYTKYEMVPYNLHIIKTDKFKTITIRFNFKRKLDKEEITYRNLLTKILLESSKNFSNKRLLEIETENLYDMRVNSKSYLSGKYNIMSFESQFLLEKYTEKGMLEKSIKFLCDLIFNPNINDNKFESDSFKIVKSSLRDDIDSYKDSPKKYSIIKMLEAMDSKSSISYQSCGYLNDLEKIDEVKLANYYNTIIKSDLLDIFIIGDVDTSLIKKIIREKVSVKTLKKPSLSHYIEHDNYRKRVRIVKEKKDIIQSRLVLGCKLTNSTDFEKRYVSTIYSFILGGSPDSKLFKEVREKKSFCYSISSKVSNLSSLMIINSGISKENYDKVVKLIRRIIKDMEKGNFTNDDINNAKIIYHNSCLEILDSPNNILNTFVSHEYLGAELINDRLKNINKVTKEMIIQFSKKVHLDTIYLLEGGNNNEKDASI